MAAHLGQKMALKRLTAPRWDLSWEILILTDYQKEKSLAEVTTMAARLVKTMAFCLVWMMEIHKALRLDLSLEILISRANQKEKRLVNSMWTDLSSAET